MRKSETGRVAWRAALVLGAATIGMLGACAGDDRDVTRDADAPPIAFDSVAGPAAPGSSEPNLTVGPDGRAYLSWIEPSTDGVHALRFASRQGERWSAARTIVAGRDFFLNWADFPSLAALDDGTLAAHWLQRSGPGRYSYDVRIARSSDGGTTWSESVVPHRDGTESEHGFASLWDEGGAVAAVWLDGRKYARAEEAAGKETMLVHTLLDGAGRPGPEVRLDERICDCCQTSVARTVQGPVVVYRDRSDDEVRDIFAVRLVEGRWSAPAPVHRDGWRIDYCPVNGPAIAAEGAHVAVAWFTAPGDTARVNVAFSADAGATFGPPVRVDEGTPAGRVGIVLLPDGAALATWIERTGAGAVVRARRVAPDGSLGAPLTVGASSAERASGFPRIVAAGDELVAAWTVPGSPSVVRVARAPLARAVEE
jgi:hypothetical protein